MQVTALHRAVPALLDELGRQGVALTELRTHSATLEDVFVALTGTGTCAMNKRDNAAPLVQLTLVRFREFLREPEALFWVFGFPIILAAGLGVAFRNRPPEVIKIGSLSAPLTSALTKEKLLDVAEFLSQDGAQQALLTGKIALLAEPGPAGQVVYHYDDTNPGRAHGEDAEGR